jgi:DNA recombination protein RmuC
MIEIGLFINSLLLIGLFIFFKLNLSKFTNDQTQLDTKIVEIEKSLSKFEIFFKDEFGRNREENFRNFKENREEQNSSFLNFSKLLEDRLKTIQDLTNQSSIQNRNEMINSFKSFEEKFSMNVKDINDLIRNKMDEMVLKQKELTINTESKLELLRETIDNKLKLIQEDNSSKLEKMRETVDEKLHKTLETRLGESFKIVSDRLELVQKGLGEMATLATGVGDLKKVLSNVKTRGILGEIQLERILEQLLTNEQYSKNPKMNQGSNEMVDFAIKIPSKEDSTKIVWLPIDSKFPTEDYDGLLNSYELGDITAIEKFKKSLENRMKSFAKDIKEKYISPPITTDFAILFLPFEGLYAEVLRIPGLFELIQRDYKITITGPTTISAFLNSLQMGFRSLVIEKRTSEVWDLLRAVKTEFGKFGTVLEKTKEKLDQASKEIDNAGVRTRQIEKKLKRIEHMPSSDATHFFDEIDTTD